MIDKAFRFRKIIDTVMFRAVIFAQINYFVFFHTVTKEKAENERQKMWTSVCTAFSSSSQIQNKRSVGPKDKQALSANMSLH